MPVETASLQDFFPGSAADLLSKMSAPKTETPAQQPAIQANPLSNTPVPNGGPQIQQFDPLAPQVPVSDPVVTEQQSAADLLKSIQQPEGEVKDVEVEDEKPAEEPVVEKKKPGRPAEKAKIPANFADLVAIAEEKGLIKGWDDGKYETVDDVLELLQANDQEKVKIYEEEAKKQFFGSMTPAMQTVAQYAQHIQNPAELIPFLEAMDNVAYSYELDADNADHHEAIVSNMLSIQGLSNDAIESEIKDLKERDKLADRAKALKPTLDRYNEQQVAIMAQQKQKEYQQEQAKWKKYQETVFEKVVKSPTVGGLKLKKQDRDLAYAALAHAVPNRGLGIYTIIDSLIENGDFDTLTELALLGTNKKNYYDYIGTSIKAEVAEETQRKLRTSVSSTPSAPDAPAFNPNKISRQQSTNSWFTRK